MTHHIIDNYHHATIHQTPGGWRVCVCKTDDTANPLRYTSLYPSLQHAAEYVDRCKRFGVDSCGICCQDSARAYVAGRRYVKPEFQEDGR